MTKTKYKNVLLQIRVPNCKFCAQLHDRFNTSPICGYFHTTGGPAQCKLSLGALIEDRAGNVLKPSYCLALTTIEDIIKKL